MHRNKVLLLVASALAIAAFFLLDLGRFLTLDYLKNSQAHLAGLYGAQPLWVAGSFFLVYVLLTALSVPGAAVLTLAAGAIFGLTIGTLIASFASSLGATLAFLASRYLLRDWAQVRAGARLTEINAGIEKEGAFYLFTLRLIPVIPFFVINLALGLTRMKTRTYYWVSQLGMLAGTLVYVNAGTQLAKIESLQGILTPAVLGSFIVLGLFPLLAKRLLGLFQARRVYGPWRDRRPSRFDNNLVVIGAGAAGLVSSYIAAAVKAKVTLVQSGPMGGDCLNYGCVPSKALLRSAKLAHQVRHGRQYGLEDTAPSFRFKEVMARVHATIRTVAPHDSVERYTGLGVEVLQGFARILDPWTVEVTLPDGQLKRLTSRSIILATGARPFVPPLPGLEEVGYVTSDTLWDQFSQLEEAPRRLVVLGGGPIGCELAQAFARLGSAVTQIEMAPRLMAREDEDAAALVRAALERDGVQVLTGHKALRCERDGDRKVIVVEHEGCMHHLEFDALLCAVGRVARLKGYGLEELGIPVARTVVTNGYLETLYPNILAAGDVAGPYQLTHAAGHQAWYAAVNALFGSFRKFKVDYSVLPWTTFVDPEVARVGLNEQEAREKGIPFEVTRYNLEDLDRAIADGSTHGFVKVLTVPRKDRILGVTIVGEHGGDLLAEFVLAMKHGLGLNKILGTIHTYPTLSEANKFAAGQWKREHAPQSVLRWLKRYHAWRRG